MKSLLKGYLLLIITLSLIVGCSDSIVESTPSVDENFEEDNVAPKFSEIQSSIFNNSCAFSGCHASGAVSPDLAGNSYNNIVNIASSIGTPLIKPNDPSSSYLLQKVLGSSGISGVRMPRNGSPLSDVSISALTDWINNGAPND